MEWSVAGWILKVVLGVALGVALVVFLVQDKLIFFPQPITEEQRVRIAQRFAGAHSVSIRAADGTRLHAWHVKGRPDAPLVMYFGGNAEEVSWMIDEALRNAPGTEWLLVDYRGYGASEGSPSEKAWVADALQWYEYASKSGQPIYLFGRSLGGGVAVQLAAARPVAGVVLVAPFDSLVQLGAHYYPFLPVRWMLRHRFDSAALAPGIAAPLLCLLAQRDEVIPVEHSRRLFDAWGGPKRWVELKGARHNSTDTAPEFWEAIRSFLGKKNDKSD
ncbi:MAG: alpha/beta hydrolase [Betaproteobacteria bacterium]|nr:MAG: alpha/beta hydrolase [Betaproteobacteria bacterium]